MLHPCRREHRDGILAARGRRLCLEDGQLAASDVTPRLRQLAPRAPRRPRGPGHRRRRGAGSDGAARCRTPRRAAPYRGRRSRRRPPRDGRPAGARRSEPVRRDGCRSNAEPSRDSCGAAIPLPSARTCARPAEGREPARTPGARRDRQATRRPTSTHRCEDQRQPQTGHRRGGDEGDDDPDRGPAHGTEDRPRVDVANAPERAVREHADALPYDRIGSPSAGRDASVMRLPQQVAAAERDLA